MKDCNTKFKVDKEGNIRFATEAEGKYNYKPVKSLDEAIETLLKDENIPILDLVAPVKSALVASTLGNISAPPKEGYHRADIKLGNMPMSVKTGDTLEQLLARSPAAAFAGLRECYLDYMKYNLDIHMANFDNVLKVELGTAD